MPKAVKDKKRLHAPAVNFSQVKNEEEDSAYDLHLKNLETIQAELPVPEIKKEEVEEEDVAQSEKKVQEPKLTKDEKRKRRRDNLLQKLNYASVEIQKQKEKKQKETPQKSKKEKEEDETPLGLLTKDLIGTLLEAEEKEERQRELKRADPVRANHMTDKDRQDLLKKEIKQFTSVTEHPVFKANPLATITEHLTNSIALQKAKDAKEPKQPKNTAGNKTNKTQSQIANEKRKASKQQTPSKDKKNNLVSIQKKSSKKPNLKKK